MRKLAYAEMFSRSLEVATGETGIYRCPLCLAAFDIEDADSLTWDHYPPRSIGGRDRDTVLVCGDCHRRWDRIDAELARLERRDEFEKLYSGMVPVILAIPDEPDARGLRHRMALKVDEGSIVLVGRPQDNAAEATWRLVDCLERVASERNWNGLRITLCTDHALIFKRPLAERSFLKAAYLAAFDCLGYPYILSQALEPVREQMRQPEVARLEHHTLKFCPQPPGFDREILLAYVHTPEPLIGLAIFFLGYALSRWCVTLLPLPAHLGLPKYDAKLDQTLRNAGRMGFVRFERSRELITNRKLILVDQAGKEWPIYKQELDEIQRPHEELQ